MILRQTTVEERKRLLFVVSRKYFPNFWPLRPFNYPQKDPTSCIAIQQLLSYTKRVDRGIGLEEKIQLSFSATAHLLLDYMSWRQTNSVTVYLLH